jgi:predicted glycosyltransferase involved in capsule biosynthesis
LNFDWEFKRIIIGLFETIEPIGQPLVKNIINLFHYYNLRNKIIAYVKNDQFNLSAMTITLKVIVSCEAMGLEENFQGTYFDLTFFKAC